MVVINGTNFILRLVVLSLIVAGFGFVLHNDGPDENGEYLPATMICYEDLTLRVAEGKVYHSEEVLSGLVYRYDENGQLRSNRSYLDGKLTGLTQRWYGSGELLEEARYRQNRLHGKRRTYYKNGQLRSVSQLIEGKINGVAIEYYDTGTLFRRRYFKLGKAVGMQQAWRPNGALYTNVEVKNGRSFGLNRAELCFELNTNEKLKIGSQ